MIIDADEWGQAGAIWIRTWYGNETLIGDALRGATKTRASADEAYLWLWRKSLWPSDQHGFDDRMFGPFVFDNDIAAYGLLARDVDDEVDLMGKIPPFVFDALTRCPDAMEGCSQVERNCTGNEESIDEIEDMAL